jgi:hypothetical protein
VVAASRKALFCYPKTPLQRKARTRDGRTSEQKPVRASRVGEMLHASGVFDADGKAI